MSSYEAEILVTALKFFFFLGGGFGIYFSQIFIFNPIIWTFYLHFENEIFFLNSSFSLPACPVFSLKRNKLCHLDLIGSNITNECVPPLHLTGDEEILQAAWWCY